jgi:hypothetical protein
MSDPWLRPRASGLPKQSEPTDHRRKITNSAIRSDSSLSFSISTCNGHFFWRTYNPLSINKPNDSSVAELRREGSVGQQRGMKRKDL